MMYSNLSRKENRVGTQRKEIHVVLTLIFVIIALLITLLSSHAYSVTPYVSSTFSPELIKKAERGDVKAQAELGTSIARAIGAGLTIPYTYADAAKWLQRAAEGNDPESEIAFGWLYAKGNGVKQDYSKAAEWFLRAIKNMPDNRRGLPVIESTLGEFYAYGKGVKQNYAEAAKWWTKAAELGSSPSQFNLGLLYYFGLGVKQSYVESYFWLGLAFEMHGEMNRIKMWHQNYLSPKATVDIEKRMDDWRNRKATVTMPAEQKLGVPPYIDDADKQKLEETKKFYPPK